MWLHANSRVGLLACVRSSSSPPLGRRSIETVLYKSVIGSAGAFCSVTHLDQAHHRTESELSRHPIQAQRGVGKPIFFFDKDVVSRSRYG